MRGSAGNAGAVATAGTAGVVIIRYPITNDGTLTNMASPATPTSGWQSEDQCVAGKCLAFDGTDDYVKVSSPVPTSLQATTAITLSAWVNPSANGAGALYQIIGSQYDTGEYKGATMFIDGRTGPTGKIHFQIGDGSAWHAVEDPANAASIPLNKWTHVVAVWSSGNQGRVYINGVLDPAIYQNTWSGSISYTPGQEFSIGRQSDRSRYFNGKLDEPKIYPYARTKAQIQTDYNAGLAGISASKGTAASFGDASDKWMSDGLVGYWKMDESSWNGTAGEVKDASGNNNNGTAAGGATTGAGKFGSGGNFDGSNDYVSTTVTAARSNIISVSTWIKPTSAMTTRQDFLESGDAAAYSTNNWIFSVKGNYGNTAGLSVLGYSPSGSSDLSTAGGVLTQNAWNNVVFTSDGTTVKIYVNGILSTSGAIAINGNNTTGEFIGSSSGGSSPFAGSIDETRIYNRALSPAEIKKLYDWAPAPIAHWKLDEKTGTSANDSSGNGNTGTLTNGPTWTQGKVGGGVKFDGVDDYVDVADNSNWTFGMNSFSLNFWIKENESAPSTRKPILSSGTSITNNNDTFSFYQSTAGQWEISLLSTNKGWVSSTATDINSWHYISIVREAGINDLYLFVDGVKLSGTVLSGASAWATIANMNFDWNRINFGRSWDTGKFQGSLDDIRIYNYARTQEQILQDMTGNVSASDLQTTKEALAYYKFDEGNGTTANNLGTGGSALNGTLTNMASPATATSGWTDNGKMGKGLNFDGVDDYVQLPDTGALPTIADSSFTVSAWAKVANANTTRNIIRRDNANNQGAENRRVISLATLTTTGFATFGLHYNGTNYSVTGSTSRTDNQWHHFVGKYDASTKSVYLYVDGVLEASNLNTGATSFNTAREPWVLGNVSPVLNMEIMLGSIDEVKIFPYALSADDVKTEYNRGNAVNMASSGPLTAGGSINSARAEYCPPGNIEGNCASGQNPSPIAEWRMDENTGTVANDTSGNNNTGTLTNGPTWDRGKFGSGVNFDGVNDRIVFPSSSSFAFGLNDFSINTWYKRMARPASYPRIWQFGDGWNTTQNWALLDGHGDFAVDHFVVHAFAQNGNASPLLISNTTIMPSRWYDLTLTRKSNIWSLYVNGVLDNSVTWAGQPDNGISNTLEFGGEPLNGTAYANGSIDQVRIYNYARTPAQIAWDYNKGGPVGWWKMDECQGTTINDASGNGNNGTLTVGATGTQTSTGTCVIASTAWGNGASGKFGSAMSFDGTDDYVNQPTAIAGIQAVSFWAKPSTASQSFLRLAIGVSVTSSSGTVNAGGFTTPTIYVNGVSGGAVSAGIWNHIVVTAGTAVTANAIKFGLAGGTYFSGQLDDIRIFNYALTNKQIAMVMNENSSLRFGSITSAVQAFVCGTSTIADFDNNTYNTVLIGTQCWMTSNMMTTKYPDGTSITRGPVTSGGLWTGADLGFYAYPPNTANNAEETLANIQTNKLGFVYQWSAAMKGSTTEGAQGICPAGWHVPTDAQQYTLENYLKTGATCDANRNNAWDCDGAGTKLKIGGSSGFNAPLAGFRNTTGAFYARATVTNLWSSSPASSSTAWSRLLYSSNSTVYRDTYSKALGFSVRCLKD